MFVILTSKPTLFRTELVEGVRPLETYDYLFYGQKKARFVIAELERDVKVRVIDEAPPIAINDVPSKFLEKFETLEDAREELNHLTTFGHMDTALERVM
jgi:hypothetical protein